MLTYSTGGPSIDAGAYASGDGNADVIRYTPPVPEFEVVILHVDPGHTLTHPNPGHPSILIILEGSGELDGKLCRPGRSYYWPANADALHFSVSEERRGPMKVAVAHKNTNLAHPTAVNRDDFGEAVAQTQFLESFFGYVSWGKGNLNSEHWYSGSKVFQPKEIVLLPGYLG